MVVAAFTKDKAAAPAQAAALAARKLAAMISVEASGANALGVYHNAVGLGVTALQSKSEELWNLLRAQGVPKSPLAIWAMRSVWEPLLTTS